MNDDLLPSNIESVQAMPPSVEEISDMFEFLDEDRTGMISSKDLLAFLELAERLKNARFD